VRVNYMMPTRDLFIHYARCLIPAYPTGILRISGTSYPRHLAGLPSWVPDWTSCRPEIFDMTESSASLENRYCAGGTQGVGLVPSTHRWERVDMQGFAVSQIASMGVWRPSFFLVTKKQQPLPAALWQFVTDAVAFLKGMPEVYARTGQPREEVVWRTLVGDRVRSRLGCKRVWFPAPPEWKSYFDLVRRASSLVLMSPTAPVPPDLDETLIWPALVQIFAACGYRKPALAEDGTVLLVPETAEIGDTVAVGVGVQRPLLLRPKNGRSGEDRQEAIWEFVGDCYAHGLMRGEALEGGAPATFAIE
jgi:hypothetical protein